jgi:hypothetical protein
VKTIFKLSQALDIPVADFMGMVEVKYLED